MRKINSKFIQAEQIGSMLIYTIVIIFIFSLVIVSALSYATGQLRIIRSAGNRELAFQIAEAGVNYYQWHLAHFPNDYQDGTGAAGPYLHDYIDKDTNTLIGRFSLDITAPLIGSTIVTIKSTGYTLANPKSTRTITTRYGIPSLSKYAFLSNSDMWFGNTESVSGELFSNGGVRFDGSSNAPIDSAKTTYSCSALFGCCPATNKPGVWGSAPPATQSFFKNSQPNVDFSSITSNLATMKSDAQTAGIYLPPSSQQGYSLVFNAAGTVDVYKVISLKSNPSGFDTNCTVDNSCNINCSARNDQLDYNARVLQFSQAIPANGLIYVEDKVWVEGVVKGRAMVVAAKLPLTIASAPNIYIPNNITYLAKDGTNVLGLLSQKDIIVTYRAPDFLEIDAALIAQNGVANFFYYPGIIKDTITIYGTVASFGTWTWSWNSPVNSGYPNTNTIYDASLLYSPPPSFPLTSNGYQQISWSSD